MNHIQKKVEEEKSEIVDADLKIARVPPIKDFSEKIAELTKGEEEAIAKIGGQGGQIRDGNHLEQYLPAILEGSSFHTQLLDLEGT